MDKRELEAELNAIIRDEQQLLFNSFDNIMAFELGMALYKKAQEKSASVTIDIRRGEQIIFHLAMEGTTPNNDLWVERKSNSVQLMHKSSWRIGRELALSGDTLEERQGLDSGMYASHGGSFPIRLKDAGVIGAVTVSGLPEKEDNALVVEVLGEFLRR